jgi:hypothetical protein
MVDDLEYWQGVLANAENNLEILNNRNIEDLRSRQAAQAAIAEATEQINLLS